METPEPRWLDEEEALAWLALVGVLFSLPGTLDTQLRCDAGLTLYEYLVLSSLSYVPDRSRRMSELAEVTSGSLPRLSQVVTKLEDRGWVQRRPDPKDGRATLAVLTKAGFRKMEESAPAHVEMVRRMVFDPLTQAQVRQLFDIHRRIKSAIDPNDGSLTARPSRTTTPMPGDETAERSRASNAGTRMPWLTHFTDPAPDQDHRGTGCPCWGRRPLGVAGYITPGAP
ncbi:MAG TPA: MarR family transcriptional regulator [Acidimicrobiales bacterium]